MKSSDAVFQFTEEDVFEARRTQLPRDSRIHTKPELLDQIFKIRLRASYLACKCFIYILITSFTLFFSTTTNLIIYNTVRVYLDMTKFIKVYLTD